MKKAIVYILVLIMMPLFMMHVISAYSEEGKPADIYGALVKERIEIWNNIYDGSYGYNMFEEQISSIEAGKLLEEDIKAFKDIKASPIDMERVKIIGMEQKGIKSIKNGYEVLLLMHWKIEGLEYEYEESSLVTIEVIKVKDKWCLSRWEDNELDVAVGL